MLIQFIAQCSWRKLSSLWISSNLNKEKKYCSLICTSLSFRVFLIVGLSQSLLLIICLISKIYMYTSAIGSRSPLLVRMSQSEKMIKQFCLWNILGDVFGSISQKRNNVISVWAFLIYINIPLTKEE